MINKNIQINLNRPDFLRPQLKNHEYKAFVARIKNNLNKSNLFSWNSKKRRKLISHNDYSNYIAYIFELFNDWIKNNERFSIGFLKSLFSLIKKIEIWDFLNQKETNYINYLINIFFTFARTLKKILVDFELNNQNGEEYVFFVYDVNYIIEKSKNTNVQIFNDSNIFLTTKRIVITNKVFQLSIDFDKIQQVKLHDQNLECVLTNHRSVFIYSNDIHFIYISLERIGKLINKYF